MLGYGRQSIDESDVAAVVAALQSDCLTQGPRVGAFEEALCAVTGAAHAVAVANGTAALQLVAAALELGPGTTVVTSPNTFLASATAFVHAGAEVDFVDVEPATGNLDLDRLEARLAAGRVDAVVAVHFAGLPVDMARLVELKRRHGFRLVEDASHALGASWTEGGRRWRPGEHPDVDAATLSFHPVKHVTTAEGGAVLAGDAALAARVRRLAAHGVDPASDLRPFDDAPARPPWFAPMVELGWNQRMSDLHAALGASQLARLDAFLARRRALARRYDEALAGVVETPHPGGDGREHARHLYVVRVDGRDALLAHLADDGVRGQVHYYPVPYQPWFRERLGARPFPAAEAHARRALSLPLFPDLAEDAQDRVVAAVRSWRGA